MTFKVGDIRKLVLESSNEFKAVIGTGVESEDKKNNGKAYSEAKKRAEDYDGGLGKKEEKEKVKYEKHDGNRTTLDYNIDYADDRWKKRVKAQAKGYTSELEMNNGLKKEGEFDKNEEVYDAIKDCGKKIHDNEKAYKRTGLQASKMPEKVFDRDEMYESKDGHGMRGLIDSLKENVESKSAEGANDKPIKTAFFKKTEFLNEAHMISRIPDEFKAEGTQFKMKDKTGSIYLMEWKDNAPCILSHVNKNGLNESISRMKNLFAYRPSDTETSRDIRMNEGEERLVSTLDKVRKITDQ